MYIGLTGGISSGKSSVSKILAEEYGAIIIDADQIAKELTAPGGSIYHALTLSFAAEGSTKKYVHKDGTINRKALADRMFKNLDEKKRIETMMHGNIISEMVLRGMRAFIDNYGIRTPLIVYDVPLLFETSFEKHTEKNIVVHVNPEDQLKRLMARNSLSEEDALLRINAQMNCEERLKRADYVIDNNGNEDDLNKEIEKVMNEMGFQKAAE